MSGHIIGPDLALAAVQILEVVTAIVREVREGKSDPDEALAKLKSMHGALDANNAAADAKLREKFESK